MLIFTNVDLKYYLEGRYRVTERSKFSKRLLLCLIALMVISIAASPVIQPETGTVWAKSKKKKKKKKKNGFVKNNGNWYYLVDGVKQTGWFTVGNRRFYAYHSSSKRGRLAKGWTTIKGTKYFFRTKGKKGVICAQAVSCTTEVNGIKCVFDEEGQIKKYKYAKDTDGFINTVGEMARANQAHNDILASLVVAQACLETGYGSSVYHNNLFGIRSGYGYRSYDSWQESMDDYVDFMKSYIPWIFGVRDSYTACSIVGRSGYAEAGGYGSLLYSIIKSNNLTRFNR